MCSDSTITTGPAVRGVQHIVVRGTSKSTRRLQCVSETCLLEMPPTFRCRPEQIGDKGRREDSVAKGTSRMASMVAGTVSAAPLMTITWGSSAVATKVGLASYGAGVTGYFCMAYVNARMPASIAVVLIAGMPPVALVAAWLWTGATSPLLSILGAWFPSLGHARQIGLFDALPSPDMGSHDVHSTGSGSAASPNARFPPPNVAPFPPWLPMSSDGLRVEIYAWWLRGITSRGTTSLQHERTYALRRHTGGAPAAPGRRRGYDHRSFAERSGCLCTRAARRHCVRLLAWPRLLRHPRR